MCHSIKKQQGASLIMAVFIIVIFSIFAAVLSKIISTNSESISFEVLGTRAYTTAVVANEWALQQLYPLNGASSCAGITATNAPDLNSSDLIINCFIEELSCRPFTHESVTYFSLSATGTCQAGEVTTSRTIEIQSRTIN